MKSLFIKLLFLINHLLLILHLCQLISSDSFLNAQSIPVLLILSLMFLDILYIASHNLRENKVLTSFCGILALSSWCILLSVESLSLPSFFFALLSPVLCYASICFSLIFLFQGGGYKYHKITHYVLGLSCILSVIALFISPWAYACMYGIQFLISIGCFLFLIFYHRKRTFFVLKSEKKALFLSGGITLISFCIYYFTTINMSNPLSNFGLYLPVLLFFISIHTIILKEKQTPPLSIIFNPKQSLVILLSLSLIIGRVVFLLKGHFPEFIVAINIVFILIYLSNIILGQHLKQNKSLFLKKSAYNLLLRQLQNEENLKSEFADFLHDHVLQDLLSIKNMIGKASRPDVKAIMTQTLENLNVLIRDQMEDYHPILLSHLTIKENYTYLIKSIALLFSQTQISTTFNCSDTLFLVKPYDTLIYRFIKELLTNIYKHSNGHYATITLTQEHGIISLTVKDNGTSKASSISASHLKNHKGIPSIKEQIIKMEGSINFFNNKPHGICIQITLPMKGEDSYQYFISR